MTNTEQMRHSQLIRKSFRPADVIPTLIIGLGGQGRRIAENLKVRLEERYESVPGKYTDHVKFFCADTNVHESFGALYPSDPTRPKLELSGDELFSLSNTPIENLKSGSHPLGRLLPAELYSDQIYQGAQQIRRLGRVSLLYHYSDFRDKLDEAIKRLLQPEKNPLPGALQRLDDKRLQVYIVCSICGGTGSGTFIDTAFIVRTIMRRYNTIATNVIGVLLLPEVFNVRGSARTRIRANAYAALLDLEYFNQPAEIGEPLYQVDLGEAGSLSASGEPFSQCYLVQGNDRYSDIDQIAPILADALETLICTEVGGKIDAVQDNIRPQFTRYPNGFRTFYSALGIERIIIPEKRLRRLRANQDMRILIKSFILGGRVRNSYDLSAPETVIVTNEAAKLTAWQAQERWDEFSRMLDRELTQHRNEAQRVSFDHDERRWLTQVLEFVQPELAYSSDPTLALRQACDETEQRLFALSRLRQEALTPLAGIAREWLSLTVIELLERYWISGGGLEWLRSWLTALETILINERTQQQARLAEHQSAMSDTPLRVRDQLAALDAPRQGRGIALFDSRKAEMRQTAGQILLQFERLWDGERDRLIDSVRADLALSISEWRQHLGEIIARWRSILSRLEAEKVQNLRFDGEQAQIVGLEHMRGDEELVNRAPQDVEHTVTTFAGYLEDRADMRGGFASVLLTDDEGARRILRHLLDWAHDPERAITSDRVIDLILNDPDAESRRRRWLSLLDNAKPLLNYAGAKLETPPDSISYLNTNSLDKHSLPPGYNDVNTLDTHEPYTLTLIRTEHAIPFDVLDAFEEYRDSYRKSLRSANPIFHLSNELESQPFDPSSRYFVTPHETARHFALAVAVNAIRQVDAERFDMTPLSAALTRAQRGLYDSVERELYQIPDNQIDAKNVERYRQAVRENKPTGNIALTALEQRFVALLDRLETLERPVSDVFELTAPFETIYLQCTRHAPDHPDRAVLFHRAMELHLHDLIKDDPEQRTLRRRYSGFLKPRVRSQAEIELAGGDSATDLLKPIFSPTNRYISAVELRLCRHVLAELRQLNRTLWSSGSVRAGYWLDPIYRDQRKG
jgi:hypothetical protein